MRDLAWLLLSFEIKIELNCLTSKTSGQQELCRQLSSLFILNETKEILLLSRYLAGDTPAKYLEWWMAAMIAYPETQKRAQQELDEVVGRERLPSFDDYDKLPYIQSMVFLKKSPFV